MKIGAIVVIVLVFLFFSFDHCVVLLQITASDYLFDILKPFLFVIQNIMSSPYICNVYFMEYFKKYDMKIKDMFIPVNLWELLGGRSPPYQLF